MKRLLIILIIGFSATSAFAQCAFQDNKQAERKDQYSKSSQTCIKNSENAMSAQNSKFQKPKYAAELKPDADVKKIRKAQF
jgi:hypothetical protein